MLKNFRSYHLAVSLYRSLKPVVLPHALKDQLHRASYSIALNLAEGAARTSQKERRRFYTIAFASLKEVEALVDLEESLENHRAPVDRLGAHLYRLIERT